MRGYILSTDYSKRRSRHKQGGGLNTFADVAGVFGYSNQLHARTIRPRTRAKIYVLIIRCAGRNFTLTRHKQGANLNVFLLHSKNCTTNNFS